MSQLISPIRPELLAAKIEKLENFELPDLFDEFAAKPRLVRALWFLQWISHPSNYAGGLGRFAVDLIAASPDSIGTAHMLKVGAVDCYELRDAVKILRELPSIAREELLGWVDASFFEEAFLNGEEEHRRGKLGESRKEWEPRLIEKMKPAALRSLCNDYARQQLAGYFKELCELSHVSFQPRENGHGAPWYFVAIADALFAYIDARAEQLKSRVAKTEITEVVSRWIAKSRNMRRSIMIWGNTRFGKTEAVQLAAQIDPGRCRLVNTPATNAITDLLREVAKSLGLEVGPSNAARDLRDRIDYVLRFSYLQMIFDESNFLLPTIYSRNTAPARLNWVRRSIMDQKIAAVFICTPQSYLPAKNRFVKTTRFAMEQFDERVHNIRLPDELNESDLLAVARVHLGDELAEEYLRYVVDKVLATERNFVSDVEKIATFAKDNAREHGRKRPTLADIEAAITDVLPASAPIQPVQKVRPEEPSQTTCKRVAPALPTSRSNFEFTSKPTGSDMRSLTATTIAK